MRLENKVVIIIGAGQTSGENTGNGRAISILFSQQGAKVFLVDRNLKSLNETKKIIKSKGYDAEIFHASITKELDCKKLVKACLIKYGKVDVLVNNVGIMSNDNFLEELDQKNWDKILETNLKGMYLSCKHTIPIMKQQKQGVILNISSTASLWSGNNYLAYNTSKAGVNGLTTSIVIDCAKNGIRVNALLPGYINTPMAVDQPAKELDLNKEKHIEFRNKSVPLNQRMGDCWDVANAALFLCSDEAKFITGAFLPVDGGQLHQRF